MNRKFKIELHCHTSEFSLCGQLSAAEIVKSYAEAGYSAINITDHFNVGYFDSPTDTVNLERYFSIADMTAALAKPFGIKIYRGVELKLSGDDINEYLLFGTDKEFLKKCLHHIYYSLPEEFYEFARAEGVTVCQCHPNRLPSCPRVGCFDGLEIYNTSPRHNSQNDKTEALAEQLGCIKISGSDTHCPLEVGLGGICADYVPENEKGLQQLILSGKYKLIKDGKIL